MSGQFDMCMMNGAIAEDTRQQVSPGSVASAACT